MEERRSSPMITLLHLGTVGVMVAWLAVACYAVAYLISR
jgi:hypothetical protein